MVIALASVTAFVAFRNAPSQTPASTMAELEDRQEADALLRRASNEEFGAYTPRQASRAIYRYSVVPGGVLDRGELRDAARLDPIVAAHYAGVSFDAVRARIVTDRRMRYMSYRLGSRIYWTRQPVALRQGETILDDGVTQVRSRCGNLISEEPRTPTYEDEPPPNVFDNFEPNTPMNGPEPAPSTGTPAQSGTIPGVPPANPGVAVPLIMAPPVAGGPSVYTPVASTLPASILFFERPVRPEQPTSPTVRSQPGQNPIATQSTGGYPPGTGPDVPRHGPIVVVSSDPEQTGSSLIQYPERPVDPIQVPEPGTLLLIGVGGAVAVARRWYASVR
jgi:hypothetical protein